MGGRRPALGRPGGTARGDLLRRQLAEVLGAQAHAARGPGGADRPAARSRAPRRAGRRRRRGPYVVVLPYPDPVAGWPEDQRAWFDGACVTEQHAGGHAGAHARPTWRVVGPRCSVATAGCAPVSVGAVVVTDGRDPEAELLLRRFTESLGEEVWSSRSSSPDRSRPGRAAGRAVGPQARCTARWRRMAAYASLTSRTRRSAAPARVVLADVAVGVQLRRAGLPVGLGDLLPGGVRRQAEHRRRGRSSWSAATV